MKFKINDIEWEIIELDQLDTRLESKGNYCGGICAFDLKEIYLSKNLQLSYKRKVLIHELSHAHLLDCLIKSTNKYDEEELCEFVAIYSQRILEIANEYFKGETYGSRKKAKASIND